MPGRKRPRAGPLRQECVAQSLVAAIVCMAAVLPKGQSFCSSPLVEKPTGRCVGSCRFSGQPLARSSARYPSSAWMPRGRPGCSTMEADGLVSSSVADSLSLNGATDAPRKPRGAVLLGGNVAVAELSRATVNRTALRTQLKAMLQQTAGASDAALLAQLRAAVAEVQVDVEERHLRALIEQESEAALREARAELEAEGLLPPSAPAT
ncbi:unnamed protein product, partial [Phaeothamnion confervicola]